MVNLILFYLIFILYNGYIIIYLTKKVREIKSGLNSSNEKALAIQLAYITRNLLSITIVAFLICVFLISSINYERNLTSPQLGLSLAVATVVFFTVFLLWDIIKEKLMNLFKFKYHFEINDIFQDRITMIIISLYAVILFLAVLSIISILLI